MSENIDPAKRYFDYWFDLISDPEKTQYLADVINKKQPHTPTDEILSHRYLLASYELLTAPPAERLILEDLVSRAQAVNYSDEAYSQADFWPDR